MAKEENMKNGVLVEEGTSELADGKQEASNLQKDVEEKVDGLVLEEPTGNSLMASNNIWFTLAS